VFIFFSLFTLFSLFSLFSFFSFFFQDAKLWGKNPCKFAATTHLIATGVTKMTELHRHSFEPITLWRGMRNLHVEDLYLDDGGAELACMSTSMDKNVVAGYARSEMPLIFKIEVKSHLEMGADISFLSLFPQEKEFLYPPLTYLKPEVNGKVDLIDKKNNKIGVQITVVPRFPQISTD